MESQNLGQNLGQNSILLLCSITSISPTLSSSTFNNRPSDNLASFIPGYESFITSVAIPQYHGIDTQNTGNTDNTGTSRNGVAWDDSGVVYVNTPPITTAHSNSDTSISNNSNNSSNSSNSKRLRDATVVVSVYSRRAWRGVSGGSNSPPSITTSKEKEKEKEKEITSVQVQVPTAQRPRPRLSQSQSQSLQIGDHLIGTAVVDLSPLGFGMDVIEGWYQVGVGISLWKVLEGSGSISLSLDLGFGIGLRVFFLYISSVFIHMEWCIR